MDSYHCQPPGRVETGVSFAMYLGLARLSCVYPGSPSWMTLGGKSPAQPGGRWGQHRWSGHRCRGGLCAFRPARLSTFATIAGVGRSKSGPAIQFAEKVGRVRAQGLTRMSFAFYFARHFLQPCGVGGPREHSAQTGRNRYGMTLVFDRLRFARWLCLAIGLWLAFSAAAQGAGKHVFTVTFPCPSENA